MPARSDESMRHARNFDWIVGTNVKWWRERREISQYDLAEAANISDSQMCRIEAGERSVTLQQAIAIADRLNVGLPEILIEEPSRGNQAA